MKINEHNYESYLLDYVDGELTDVEQNSLLQYLEQHPELKKEFKLLQKTKLEPDDAMSFPDKSALYNPKKKDTLQPVKVSWWGFELGLNNFVDKSNYGTPEVNDFVRLGAGNPEAGEELFSLRAIKSVNVNIWPVWVKASLIKHVLNLKTGIGVEMNNYRYTKNITYVDAVNSTYIKMDDVHFRKNKLFTEYLTIPILLDLDTNPYHNNRAFRLSAGPTFGYLIKSRTKQISSERRKQKNNSSFNLEKNRAGLRAEIGYGPISVYGAYSFTPIHKNGLKQYPFSIGVVLTGSRGW